MKVLNFSRFQFSQFGATGELFLYSDGSCQAIVSLACSWVGLVRMIWGVATPLPLPAFVLGGKYATLSRMPSRIIVNKFNENNQYPKSLHYIPSSTLTLHSRLQADQRSVQTDDHSSSGRLAQSQAATGCH